jgi:hypothetical protein
MFCFILLHMKNISFWDNHMNYVTSGLVQFSKLGCYSILFVFGKNYLNVD